MKRIGLWLLLLGGAVFPALMQAQSADLLVNFNSSEGGIAGTPTSYSVEVVNNGPNAATGVTFTNPVPAGLTFVSMQNPAGQPFSCIGGAAVTCTGSLPAGSEADFTLNFNINSNVADGTTINSVATVSSATSDPNPANNSTQSSLYVTAQATLNLTKTGPGTVTAGSNLTYTLTLSNTGPSDAQAASLTDYLPYNTTFVSINQTSGPTSSCVQNTGEGVTETCNVGTLPAKATATFSLVVNVPAYATGTIYNYAYASTNTSLSEGSQTEAYLQTSVNVPPYSCTAQATAVPVRAESSTELTADLVVTCHGGSPAAPGTPLSTNTITIGFNSNVSSRILNADSTATEALLLIDEPQPGSQFPCDPGVTCAAYGNGTGTGYYGGGTADPESPANRNIYQGEISPVIGRALLRRAVPSNNSITWTNVPIDPPGPGTRTYRFTNLRLDATAGQNPLAITYVSTAVISPVFANNVPGVQLPVQLPNNSPLSIATPQTSLAGNVRDAADAANQSTGVALPISPLGLPPTRVANLRFASGFPGADKPRTAATFVNADTSPTPADQNIPGKKYGSESGFFNSAFGTNGSGGNLGTAGLADTGTRYMAVFNNIPAGFSLYVDLVSATTANGNVARLISTDANGAGPFTIVPGTGMAQLTVTGGTATAVWEVLQNSASSPDQFDFGVYLSSVAGINTVPPPINVQMRYAPFSPAVSIPLFTGITAKQTLVNFQPAPQLFVAPTSLSFSSTAGGVAPPSQTLSIVSTSANYPINFNLSAGSLVRLQSSSGTTPANISVTPVTANLASGTYQDVINIVGNGGTTAARIPVTLRIADAPQITSVSPTTVAAGGPAFTLTVNGFSFVSGTVLQWNGSALPTNFVSTTQLTASVASSLIAQPGNAFITALTPDQAVSNSVNVPVTGPRLTALSPSTVGSGAAGFTLSLSGTGFQQGATVNIGASTLQPSSVSSTAITVAVPASLVAQAGTLSVTVTNPGNLTTNALTLTVTSGLSISALSPSSATAGSPAISLTITGSGFSANDVVKWNGQSLSTSLASTTQVTAQVPASLLATAGTASVSVATADGVTSNVLPFTINAALSITSLNPSSATVGSGAFTITVQGANFASGATVLWNGQALATAVVSANQLTAQVPAGLVAAAGAVSVTVAAADGASSNALPFTLKLPPLTNVGVTAPPSSTSGQDQTITVNLGSTYPVDLVGTLTLTFTPQGNLPDDPSIQFQSGNRVYTFTIPAGTPPGPVQVMISTGTVAGTITITPTFTASGTDVTPAGTAPEIIQIAPAAPSLSQMTCVANSSGFTATIDGYSNTRDVSQANFTFQAAPGATLGTSQLSLAVTPIFSNWFGGSASVGAGGEFQYTQPFSIQGSLSTISSVSVTLNNSTGTSNSVSCQMP